MALGMEEAELRGNEELGFCLFGKIGRAAKSCGRISAYDAKAQAGIRLLDSGDPNSLLILQSMHKPNGERIRQTKLVRAGADPHEIDVREPAAHFEGYGVDVSTFDLLHGLTAYLLGRSASFAVHGALIDGVNPKRFRRVLNDGFDKFTGEPFKAAIRDKAGFAFAIDIDDKLPCPLGADSLEDKVAYVRSMLPAEFQGVRCIGTATSSYGIKPGLFVRLWFLTDRPLTCAEKRRWLEPIGWIDPALYSANQQIFTAAPIFEDEADNPLPNDQRLVVLDGCERVTPPIAEKLKPKKTFYAPIIGCGPIPGGSSSAALSAACVAIKRHGKDANDARSRHQLIFDECRHLTDLTIFGHLDEGHALARVVAAGVSIGKDEEEIKRIFRDTLRYRRETIEAQRKTDVIYGEED
jgi:hypothetical protein